MKTDIELAPYIRPRVPFPVLIFLPLCGTRHVADLGSVVAARRIATAPVTTAEMVR